MAYEQQKLGLAESTLVSWEWGIATGGGKVGARKRAKASKYAWGPLVFQPICVFKPSLPAISLLLWIRLSSYTHTRARALHSTSTISRIIPTRAPTGIGTPKPRRRRWRRRSGGV